MAAERLKDDRALQVQDELLRRNIHLVSNEQDDRELPTAPENLKPSEPTELAPAIPKLRPVPADIVAAIRRLPAPNPDSYVELAIAVLLRGVENQQGLETLLDSAVDRIDEQSKEQTDRILRETGADIGLIRSSIHGLQQSVDALVTRIGNTETQLDAGIKRFAALDEEIAALKSQMIRLEQLRPYLERLEAELASLKREGLVGSASQTA